MNKQRCSWPHNDEKMLHYHDTEWGIPLYDDTKLFEFFVLDAFQAGLSWRTVLHKRENFEKAFHKFDVKKIAKYTEKDIERLLKNEGIIRNQQKIRAAVKNAQAFIAVQKEYKSFANYIWQFTSHKPIINSWKKDTQIPARSPESDAMALDLKKRNFSFCGSTICYAFMQASGMVNDHLVTCFRYREVQK